LKNGKKNKLAMAAAIIAGAAVLTVTLHAAGAGTPEDPLVTLSYINGEYRTLLLTDLLEGMDDIYLENFKSNLKASIYDDLLADVIEYVDSRSGTALPEQQDPVIVYTPSESMEYEVVMLNEGQKLRAVSACEIILRSGKATAFVESEVNREARIGLSDCTDGSEIVDLQEVPLKHYLIIPRADGRGIKASVNETYVMVRGEYEIIS